MSLEYPNTATSATRPEADRIDGDIQETVIRDVTGDPLTIRAIGTGCLRLIDLHAVMSFGGQTEKAMMTFNCEQARRIAATLLEFAGSSNGDADAEVAK